MLQVFASLDGGSCKVLLKTLLGRPLVGFVLPLTSAISVARLVTAARMEVCDAMKLSVQVPLALT